jgi:hypothetical protein
MKRIILVIAVLTLSITCFSQTGKSVKEPVDTAATQQTPLLTYQDWIDFNQKIVGDLPNKYAQVIIEYFEQRFALRAREYADKKKAIK